MLVYRIQNKKNNGAYSSYSFERLSDKKHPIPREIKIKIDKHDFCCSDFFYGFKNLKQLKKWFDKKARLGLDRDGFFVAVYQIEKKYCFSDEFQAAFYLRKAKFIKDMDLVRHIK